MSVKRTEELTGFPLKGQAYVPLRADLRLAFA